MASELRTYIRGLDKVSVPADTDLVDASTSSVSYTGQGVDRRQVTESGHHASNTFESITAFDVHADVTFPGSTVQGGSLTGAVLSPIPLPRAGGDVVLTNLTTDASAGIYAAHVDSVGLGTVQQSIQKILEQKFGDNTAAKMSYYTKQFYSLDHAMMEIGASASWLSGDARAQLSSDSYSETNNYVVKFVQAYYTVSFQPPPFPESFFAAETTVEDASLYMGQANPPVYVSSVTYGRMLLLFASSDKSSDDLKASLEATFSFFMSGGDISVQTDSTKILQESDCRILILGGPSSGAVKLLTDADKAAGLKAYLVDGANFTKASPGVPISYEARYLSDFSVAQVAFVTNYSIRTEAPSPANVTAIELIFHTKGDDKDDSALVNVEIGYRGAILWRGSFGDGDTWDNDTDQGPYRLPLSRSVPLNDVKGMTFRCYQTKDNTGWAMSYDLYAFCDDDVKRQVSSHGVRSVGDASPGDFTDAFTGS